MPKVTVELSKPRLRDVVLVRDGEPLENVSQFSILLDAQGPDQFFMISREFARNGDLFRTIVCHDIKSMSLTVEYEEGE